ncbi:LPD38 domain-containing protein [Paenibacillus jilunlii]|uniref:Large polyvalent protein associated domain-containing protein n=1 Tax=Paenibacillus jilunlii TaxID=682956 RepID=A0A1H0ACQ8_9BACL|nr:LPD38 domain-containing protein [Paenibacillus jilunlii]KWX79909.1 hypothetical protein AML91_01705 [Paenibacillus jilunlii]SDN31197.1 hypothetical protein SAMN05216191_1376 [Paenibacillus jilunlii]
MSTFDAVRNRKRGEDAKQRVLNRTYNPQTEQESESKFSAVRNRQIIDTTAEDNARGKTLLDSTLASVGKGPQVQGFNTTPEPMKPIDFKADQAKQKQIEAFQGKLPAPSALNIPVTSLQTQLQGRLPAASVLNQTGGGPAAPVKPVTEYDIRQKAIDETNMPDVLKTVPSALNYLAFGNPVGRFISNSFAGNSGVTQRDSTGNATADKVSNVINNLVTPFITPTGAPVGLGPNAAPYEAAGKLMNTGAAMKATNAISKVIPKVSPSTANNIVRGGLTEGLAGTAQNVAAGLMNQQDSNKDILRNALIGGGFGLGLGAAGGAVRSGFEKFADVRAARKSGTPEAPVAAETPSAPIDTTPSMQPVRTVQEPITEAPEPIATAPETKKPVVDENLSARDREILSKPVSEWTQDDIDYAMQSSKEAEATLKSTPAPEPKPIAEPEPIKTPVKTEVQEVEEAIQAVNHPNVRDKVYTYLDEAEKAARERLAKRRGNLNSNPLPEWADYAVIMASKLGKGTIKAANFTEELVKEFGEAVRPHAEKILRMSREELRRQERLASDEGKAAAEFNAKPEGDSASFREKISRNVSKKSTPFSERWQKWRTQTTDDLAALETVEKNVRGGKLASAEDSLYKSARLFKGAPERASRIVQDRLGPVISKVESMGKTAEDLEDYVLAMHARDVNAAGYKSGYTNQEIKSIIDELDSPEMKAAQQELVKVNRDMLKELVDSGVVSKELYDVLGERWKNYIPLFREMDNEKVGFGGGLSSALANVTSPIKALQGSERKVIAPLENMVKNIFQSVNAAERNNVARQIPKLAELDGNGTFFRKLTNAEQVGEKNVVKVKVDGKEVRYEVQPEVYKALMNLDKESSNTLINILSKPASLLRAGATLTPEFALRNPIRDINNAFVVSESGFNPITDFGAGLIQTITKGPLYKEWIDNLGAYGNTLSMDRNLHRKALETVLKQPNSKKFVNLVNGKSLIGLLRAISDTTESATKVGEYRAALRSGASKQEAAYRSRDLMDFARGGASVRPLNRVVSFFNANVQGKSKLIRAIKNDPLGVVSRGFVSVTAPTIGIFIANREFANKTQKDTIANAPDWMKDSFWLLAVPGTDTVARIPKPFDLAAVFANLPEKALDFVFNKDSAAFDGFARRALKDSSLPTQISGLLPLYEGYSNYSFFKEGPIIPRSEQGLEFSDQYDPVRTTTSARIIAGGVEKLTGGKGTFKNFSSPRVIDNTLQGLTAGVGKYATDVVDLILDKTGVYERTTKPAKSIEQAPFTRSFLVDPNQGGKAMDKFYMKKDELTKEKASAKLNKVPFKNQGQLDRINNVSDAVSDINKRIKAIERGQLSAKQKQLKIEPLIKRRNEMIQRITQSLKDKK